MEGGEPVMVSVITLCRDNPDVLRETLESIREQCLSPNYAVEVLVVDGSGSPRCREVVHHYPLETEGSGWRLRWTACPPRGIYEALNAGLELVRGRWVHMLPAGDAYADAGSLQRLLRHAEGLTAEQGHPPAAVFGQAWVEVPGRPSFADGPLIGRCPPASGCGPGNVGPQGLACCWRGSFPLRPASPRLRPWPFPGWI